MIEKGTGLYHSVREANKLWLFRLKLIIDHIRWDSLKISPSQEFEDHILRKLDEASRKEKDVEIFVHHIVAKQEDFKALVSDAARTDRFVNEMELFLASGLNIEAHDAVYMQRSGWNSPRVTIQPTERESSGQAPVIVPYLYVFDEDSDGTD
ncbi:hypothetical protein Pint_19912 [Pistacia integerrima]|uniref:Uncharacterized protein n=1 Tax=Pistacia integerrima TaxID=434235 RepID=A0ACC0X8L8_9ROSI|nr:hypothetical protein Pint_19912 [Pistacia integerrima]